MFIVIYRLLHQSMEGIIVMEVFRRFETLYEAQEFMDSIDGHVDSMRLEIVKEEEQCRGQEVRRGGPSFEEVMPQIRTQLMRQEMSKRYAEWAKGLRDKAAVKIML